MGLTAVALIRLRTTCPARAAFADRLLSHRYAKTTSNSEDRVSGNSREHRTAQRWGLQSPFADDKQVLSRTFADE